MGNVNSRGIVHNSVGCSQSWVFQNILGIFSISRKFLKCFTVADSLCLANIVVFWQLLVGHIQAQET